jgi:hypothetical protein
MTHVTGTTPGPAFASKKRLFVMAVTFWRKDESEAKEGRCRNHPNALAHNLLGLYSACFQ